MWIEPRSTFITSLPPALTGKPLVMVSCSAPAVPGLAAKIPTANRLTIVFIVFSWLTAILAGITHRTRKKLQENSDPTEEGIFVTNALRSQRRQPRGFRSKNKDQKPNKSQLLYQLSYRGIRQAEKIAAARGFVKKGMRTCRGCGCVEARFDSGRLAF